GAGLRSQQLNRDRDGSLSLFSTCPSADPKGPLQRVLRSLTLGMKTSPRIMVVPSSNPIPTTAGGSNVHRVIQTLHLHIASTESQEQRQDLQNAFSPQVVLGLL
ncbi:hypothetical protein GBAR_LOCUS22173, partial [Geodia barretti]